MLPVEMAKDVYWVGVNDRTTDLFEGIWPIDQGVTYNAYLLRNEKTALIDPVRISKVQRLIEQLEAVCEPTDIDYLILNHMEQDHTGSLNVLRSIMPDTTIVGTEKTRDMLESFYGITENVEVVEDGDTLNLGDVELTFLSTPFVHWPETMMTFEADRGILFSGDGFGLFGALRGGLFDDQVRDWAFYESEGLRYYANVVAKYSRPLIKVLDQFSDVELEMVAPSHGLVWREDPGRIVQMYETWASYSEGPAEPEITIVYGSMYGFTERMMNAVAQGASETGVPVEIFDAGRIHDSYILSSLWERQGVLVAAPTYEGELFPPVSAALQKAVTKLAKNRTYAVVGSHGWRGGAFREIDELVEPLKWDKVDELEFTGKPTREDLQEGRKLGARLAQRIGER